jgi:hypothetical protein
MKDTVNYQELRDIANKLRINSILSTDASKSGSVQIVKNIYLD